MKLKGLSRILKNPGAALLACLKISDFIEKVKLFPMLPEDFFIVISLLLIVVRTRIFRTSALAFD